jgi:hypothetical protein
VLKILKIILLTVIAGFAGFVIGYILFGKYDGQLIPLKSIFDGTAVEDGFLNSVLFMKAKIVGCALFLAFAGTVIAVLIEIRGGSKESADFYQCKCCGFKVKEKDYFCIACDRDENGFTKEDYKRRAAEKTTKV